MERTILHISWISELIWLTRLDHAKQFTIIKQNWLASIRALYVPLEFLLFFHCCNDCIVIYSYIVCNAYYILYYIWYICISYILYDSLNVAQCNPQLWASNSEISSVVQMPQICLSQDNVPTGVTETTRLIIANLFQSTDLLTARRIFPATGAVVTWWGEFLLFWLLVSTKLSMWESHNKMQ